MSVIRDISRDTCSSRRGLFQLLSDALLFVIKKGVSEWVSSLLLIKLGVFRFVLNVYLDIYDFSC